MYIASENRYNNIPYHRTGTSGLLLPAVSLGLWHNFGDTHSLENMRRMCFTAFDNGITHFELANNYGPPEGAAEINFGRILKEDLGVYRDEMIISTKAGYWMWPDPYGEWGSRKNLGQIQALHDLALQREQSLAQMALSWVLRDGIVTSVPIGASKPGQILDNIKAAENTVFTADELELIDQISLGTYTRRQ